MRACGWNFDIGVEIHRNMIPGDSIVLAQELEIFKPFFFEDPIAPDSVLFFGEVSEKTRIPMAAGERYLTIWEFREYVERAGIHFIRPDVGIAGGFTHVKKNMRLGGSSSSRRDTSRCAIRANCDGSTCSARRVCPQL